MPALGPPDALSPQQWNAQVDYDAWRDLFSPDDGIGLHHGGGFNYLAGRPPFSRSKEITQLQSWEQSHLNKGWRGLAYGWGIGQTGTIYRIRGWARYGAHTGDVDGDGIANNDEIIPFIIIGSGHHHTLSPAAEAAIVRLRRFVEEGSPDATYLYGHQELKGIVTSCPGPNFMEYVRAHRLLEEDMPTAREIWDEPAQGGSLPAGEVILQTRWRAGQALAVAKSILKAVNSLAEIDSAKLAQDISAQLETEGIPRATIDLLVAELTD